MTNIDFENIILSHKSTISKIIISSPIDYNNGIRKIIIRIVKIKQQLKWQIELYKNNQVFHNNMDDNSFIDWLNNQIISFYKQINIFYNDRCETYTIKGNKIKCNVNMDVKNPNNNYENNRKKNYILTEGIEIPALVDLGVFTKDFKVINCMYDKYKQINRFIELIDDIVSKKKITGNITIVDFGCGKSYLTFIVYYYFNFLRNIKATIIGYDLKDEVVENCNKIAKKYGYNNLHFYVKNVISDNLYEDKVDMVISLHACDIATDYALYYAIKNDVSYILSVPCCQHQINQTIKNGGELDIFLKYGLIKERMSSLLTDAIRAYILEDMGYKIDMIELVDFSHSPKNILIRAEKVHKRNCANYLKIKSLIDNYGFKQMLYELVY